MLFSWAKVSHSWKRCCTNYISSPKLKDGTHLRSLSVQSGRFISLVNSCGVAVFGMKTQEREREMIGCCIQPSIFLVQQRCVSLSFIQIVKQKTGSRIMRADDWRASHLPRRQPFLFSFDSAHISRWHRLLASARAFLITRGCSFARLL